MGKPVFKFEFTERLYYIEVSKGMEASLNHQGKGSRLNYIDNLKAFAMIMIILGHCNLGDYHSYINTWIHSFHVPVFFMISGYLFRLKENKQNIVPYNLKKKSRTYLIPFCFFSMLYAIITCILIGIHDYDYAISMFRYSMISTLMLNGRVANWYLPCLMLVELIFTLERKYLNLLVLIVINIVLAVSAFFIPHDILVVQSILRSFIGVFCFTAGYCFYDIEIILKNRKIRLVALLISITAYSFLLTLNGKTALYDLNPGNSIWMYLIEIVIGSSILIGVFKLFVNRKLKFFTWFGRNTLIIMTTHELALQVLMAVDGHLGSHIQQLGGLTPFLVCVLLVILEIPIILFCDKYLYFIYGKKTVVAKKGM